MMPIPKLDPQVKYIGASRLRQLTAKSLAELKGAIVVQATDASPLAVIVPFATWQQVQRAAEAGGDRQAVSETDALSSEPLARALVNDLDAQPKRPTRHTGEK